MKDCLAAVRRTVSAPSTSDHQAALVLWNAHRGFDFCVRVQGMDIDWRILRDGVCGSEVVASGTLLPGSTTSTTVVLPGTWGDNKLRVEARLNTAATAQNLDVSATWRQVIPGFSPTDQPD